MLRARLAVRTPWIILGGAILLFLVPLFVKNFYILDLMFWVFLYTLFSTAVYQIAVVNRLLFGAAAFIGIGAYTSALLVVNLGMPFWPAMLLAGIASAIVAFVIGIPMLRVRGIYFAILTWCLVEVVVTFYKELPWFGRSSGIKPIPPASIFGTTFTGVVPYYYLALGLTFVSLVFFYRLAKSRFGQDLKAVGLSDDLAASLGINVPRYRLICFVISCFFLGIGGSVYATYEGVIVPYFFGINFSIQVFTFLAIGGIGSLWGGLLGSTIMILIPEWLHAYEYIRPLLYGVVLMIVIIIIPGGLISLPRQVKLWRRGKLLSGKI